MGSFVIGMPGLPCAVWPTSLLPLLPHPPGTVMSLEESTLHTCWCLSLLFLISELQAKYYHPGNANILEMQKYVEAECVFLYKMVTIQNIPYTNFIKYQHRFSFSFSQDLTDSRGSENSSQRNTTLNILLNDSEKQPEFSSLALG